MSYDQIMRAQSPRAIATVISTTLPPLVSGRTHGKPYRLDRGMGSEAAGGRLSVFLLPTAVRDIFPEKEKAMMSTVIGGAMLPHAPQFFTLPETEDKTVVAHVRDVAADIGRRLRALNPDLWIIFSNDHAEQFFHTTAPPFTIHVGGEATGEF